MSITVQELKKKDKETYQIIDIRDEVEVAHGEIPGAINVPRSAFPTALKKASSASISPM